MDYIDKRENLEIYSDVKAEIMSYIEKNLSERRLKHTCSVVNEAIKLAKHYGEDVKKAELAALFHDMFRSTPASVLNMYIRQLGLPKNIMDNPNLSHGKIAAEMIQRDFGITDQDIINAVSYHTTGRANMSLLEKVIYIADAIEPNRKYPGVNDLREAVKEDLDNAILMSLNRTINYVTSEGNYLDEDTIHAKQYLEEYINKGE